MNYLVKKSTDSSPWDGVVRTQHGSSVDYSLCESRLCALTVYERFPRVALTAVDSGVVLGALLLPPAFPPVATHLGEQQRRYHHRRHYHHRYH